MATYHLITKDGCPACVQAKEALTIRSLPFTTDNRNTPEELNRFIAEGHRSFPRVFVDGELIGGCSDLLNLLNSQEEF